MKIIHRDLKAENVMICSQGHIVLTGFGHAECSSLKGGVNSLKGGVNCAGSHHDLGESQPPESILGWKHDFAVDCWSFGILVYMMQAGKVIPTFRRQRGC